LRWIETEDALEEALSCPGPEDIEAMRSLSGDILVLGAGGKMGPSLARLARRASDAAGVPRRVLAVSRFSEPAVRAQLNGWGIETLECDLMEMEEISRLPSCENVLYLTGRKFGSAGRPELTWAANAVVPIFVARKFAASKIVAFSTGNVYPFVSPSSGGSVEEDLPQPAGEYAQSCLGRERIFEFWSRRSGTRMLLFRLNYACDLRYGVLVDIARAVFDRQPVKLAVGYFNTLWQGDANSYALRCLSLCQSPPPALNVTGGEIMAVREAAVYFARLFGRNPQWEGQESDHALLSNASRCRALLGPPKITASRLMEWIAHWIQTGGASLHKPTHFEVQDGRF
jgi:nucleoside-diphosphate-sugar epimerase